MVNRKEEISELLWEDTQLIAETSKKNVESFYLAEIDAIKNESDNPIHNIKKAIKFSEGLLSDIEHLREHPATSTDTSKSQVLAKVGWYASGNIARHISNGKPVSADFEITPKRADMRREGHEFDLLFGSIKDRNGAGLIYKSVGSLEEAEDILLSWRESLLIEETVNGKLVSKWGYNNPSVIVSARLSKLISQRGDVHRLEGFIRTKALPGLEHEFKIEKARDERIRKTYGINTPEPEPVSVSDDEDILMRPRNISPEPVSVSSDDIEKMLNDGHSSNEGSVFEQDDTDEQGEDVDVTPVSYDSHDGGNVVTPIFDNTDSDEAPTVFDVEEHNDEAEAVDVEAGSSDEDTTSTDVDEATDTEDDIDDNQDDSFVLFDAPVSETSTSSDETHEGDIEPAFDDTGYTDVLEETPEETEVFDSVPASNESENAEDNSDTYSWGYADSSDAEAESNDEAESDDDSDDEQDAPDFEEKIDDLDRIDILLGDDEVK